MTYAEQSRQYQASLEHRRRARTELEGSVSMLGELDRIEAEHAEVERRLTVAWLEMVAR